MRLRSPSVPAPRTRAGAPAVARPRRAGSVPAGAPGPAASLGEIAERAARWGHRLEGGPPPASLAVEGGGAPIQRNGGSPADAQSRRRSEVLERQRRARQRVVEERRRRASLPAPEHPLALAPPAHLPAPAPSSSLALVPSPASQPAAPPPRLQLAPEVAAAERHRIRQLLVHASPDRVGGNRDEFERLIAELARHQPPPSQPEPENRPPADDARQAGPLAIMPPVDDRPRHPPPAERPPDPPHVAAPPDANPIVPHVAAVPQPQQHQPAQGASLSSSLGEMLDRWAPSAAVTDPNVLQLPGTVLASGNPLPSSATPGGTAQAAFSGASVAGTGMQFLGSVYGVGKSIATLSGDANARERKAAAVDLGEGVVNTAGTGSSLAQSGINLAGSAAPHAATVAAGALGSVSGVAGTGIGTWWLAKHGRRAVSSARRYGALRGLESEVDRRQRPALSVNDNEAAQPLLQAQPHALSSPAAREFLSYARRKNRNQTARAGLGALSGGLGAAAGAAGIAALLGATAATPVGWGLAAAGAAVGLGLGAWKFGQWARRKYQTARLGGQGRWGSFKSIFTRGKTRLQQEAIAKLQRDGATPAEASRRNPFGQAEHHANWLAGSLERNEAGSQELLRALNLHDHAGFRDAHRQGNRAEMVNLIKHRLRSSG